MGMPRQGSLGDLNATGAGPEADVSDLEEVGVTVEFSTVDGSALHLEYRIGTAWFDCPGVGTFTGASFTESGTYVVGVGSPALAAGVEGLRAYVDTANGAIMRVRYCGRDVDLVG